MASIPVTIPKYSDVQSGQTEKQAVKVANLLVAKIHAYTDLRLEYADIVAVAPGWAGALQGDIFNLVNDAFSNQGWTLNQITVDGKSELFLNPV
jgi:hypothetical protein